MNDDADASAIADVLRLADSMWPHAVRAAATLRLADKVAAGTSRAGDLADATGSDRDSMARLLAYLAARGLFRQTAPGEFELTAAGQLLIDDHPSRLRARLDLSGLAGRLDGAAAALLTTIETGQPCYEGIFGRPYYEDLAAHPRLFAEFDSFARYYTARAVGEVLGYNWAGVGLVVDVGGGSGMLLARLLSAEPDLRGILVDLPSTAAEADAAFARAGVGDRVQVVQGSFFDPLPAGGDVYLLSGVLIDWADDAAAAILRRCREAVGSAGRVLIAEQREPDESAATDENLRIAVLVGGRARTLEEFHDLARVAGLRVLSARRNPAGVCLVECAT